MLTRVIVDLYAWIIEFALWALILASALLGFAFFVPAVGEAGWVLEHELAWRILGAVLSATFAFLTAVVFVGPLVLLVDIRRSVRDIESRLIDADPKQEAPAHRPNPFAFEVDQPH